MVSQKWNQGCTVGDETRIVLKNAKATSQVCSGLWFRNSYSKLKFVCEQCDIMLVNVVAYKVRRRHFKNTSMPSSFRCRNAGNVQTVAVGVWWAQPGSWWQLKFHRYNRMRRVNCAKPQRKVGMLGRIRQSECNLGKLRQVDRYRSSHFEDILLSHKNLVDCRQDCSTRKFVVEVVFLWGYRSGSTVVAKSSTIIR